MFHAKEYAGKKPKRCPFAKFSERSRDENGNLVFKKISDSSNMHQESGSSGNRREFLDMMLNWERGFKAHHLNATLKYTQNSNSNKQRQGITVAVVSCLLCRSGRAHV